MSHDRFYREYRWLDDWIGIDIAPRPCPFGATLKKPVVAIHIILHPFKSKTSRSPNWNFISMYFSSSHDPADLSDIEYANMNGNETDKVGEMKNITPKVSYRFERLEGTSIATRYWPIERGFNYHGGCMENIVSTLGLNSALGRMVKEALQ
tara:strand:+ start:74 stop:526 length:453 start_codon:yes stop_codon:yes gene_type:complete